MCGVCVCACVCVLLRDAEVETWISGDGMLILSEGSKRWDVLRGGRGWIVVLFVDRVLDILEEI